MKKLYALLFLLTTGAVAQVPTLVRSTPFDYSSAGTNSPTVTIPASAAGDSLVVEVFGSALATGITDNAGNTYTTCRAKCSGSNSYDFYVAGTFHTASSVSTVTINAGNGPRGRILEISNGGVGFAVSADSYNPGYTNAGAAGLSLTLTKQSLVFCTGDYLGGTPTIAGTAFTGITPLLTSLEATANVTAASPVACNVTWDGSGYGKPAIVEFAVESVNAGTAPAPASMTVTATPNPVGAGSTSTLSTACFYSDGSAHACPAITYTSSSPGVSISGNTATPATAGTATITGAGAGYPSANVSVTVLTATPASFVGLLTNDTSYGVSPADSRWTSWYTPNATLGQPGTYSGPAPGGTQADQLFPGELENIAVEVDLDNLDANTASLSPMTRFYRLGRTHALHAENHAGQDNKDYYAQPNAVWDLDGNGFSFTSTGDFSNLTRPMSEMPVGQQPYMVNYVNFTAAAAPAVTPSTALAVTYGANGIQTLAYAGVTLHDASTYPADVFHISHMKTTDLSGTVLHGAGLDYGETGVTKAWNVGTKTMLYTYAWGTVSVQFADTASKLDVITTLHVNTGANVILDGAEVHPFGAHFPSAPANFNGYPVFAYEVNGPGVTIADYGTGKMAAVVLDATKPLYSGFDTVAGGGTTYYTPIISGTGPDNLASFYPHFERAVQPGQTDTFTVSYRFSGANATPDASDAYANFATVYPGVTQWTDHRIAGFVALGSSQNGANKLYPSGSPTNPRRWYWTAGGADITTTPGLEAFQNRVLVQAQTNVANCQSVNCQGVYTWDIEGEQYPQDTTYLGAPDEIAIRAPEMDIAISGQTGGLATFNGMKLDDAYFKIMRDAGLKVGLTLRPQHLTAGTDVNGVATLQQVDITNPNGTPNVAGIVAELKRKAEFANARWGATMFYVDSTVDTQGGVLPDEIWRQMQILHPSWMFSPEESDKRTYAYVNPFKNFIFGEHSTGTDASIYAYYRNAFSVLLVNESSPASISAARPALTQSVSNGDILIDHVEDQDGNLPTLAAIYSDATSVTPQSGRGSTTPPPPPPPTPSSITFTAPNPIAIAVAATVTPTCAVLYSDSSTQTCVAAGVTFTSSAPSTATVSGTGDVTGAAAGSGTITAALGGVNGTDAFTVTSAAPPPPTLQSVSASLSATSTDGFHAYAKAVEQSFGGGRGLWPDCEGLRHDGVRGASLQHLWRPLR